MIIGIDASRAYVKNRSGTENYSYQIINSILKTKIAKNHKFILYVRRDYDESQVPRYENLEVRLIKNKRLWTQLGLAFCTWKEKLDVLFVPAHTLPVLRRPGLRTVVTVHGLEYEWLPEYKNMLQRWYLPLSTTYAVGSASKIISVSSYTKTQIVRRLGAKPDKIKVIHEGVDKEFFEEKLPKSKEKSIKSRYEIPGEYLLFVGTIMPRKNLAFMIRVYARLAKKHDALQFFIAGSKGWMFEDVYEEIRRNKIGDKVKILGRVSDDELKYLMQNAILYVQPSITEGFGLPVLEAMASSCPVVVSGGGALPEVAGEAGVVISSFDEREWEGKISKIIDSKAKRQVMMEKGLERVKELSWEKAALKTIKLLVK